MPGIRPGIALTTSALAKLTTIWDDKNIDLSSQIRQNLRSIVMSIFLYYCETWTLTAEIERKIQVMEMRSFRRLLSISYKYHITNEEFRRRIQKPLDLTKISKRCRMKWYGHVTRSSGLANTVLQGTVRGGWRRGRENDGKITCGIGKV